MSSPLTRRLVAKRIAGLFFLTFLFVLAVSLLEGRPITPTFLFIIITGLGMLFVCTGALTWKFREKIAQGASLETPAHKILYAGLGIVIFGVLHFFFPPVPMKAYILFGIGGGLFALGAFGISRWK